MTDKPEPLWRRLAREANERRQREQSRVMDMSLTVHVDDSTHRPQKQEKPR
jgi:hypothetical protein